MGNRSQHWIDTKNWQVLICFDSSVLKAIFLKVLKAISPKDNEVIKLRSPNSLIPIIPSQSNCGLKSNAPLSFENWQTFAIG
ncbi:hypothetical protein C7B76_15080 [filamentous cyanobacterium CCP2]|nr:hypothetical protein C7B76_15080 [filamentous cyanobacterium CCP2]